MGRVPALKIRSQTRLSPFSREYSCLEGEVLSAAPSPAQGEGAAGKGQEAAAGGSQRLETPNPWNVTPKRLLELSLEPREQRERGIGG